MLAHFAVSLRTDETPLFTEQESLNLQSSVKTVALIYKKKGDWFQTVEQKKKYEHNYATMQTMERLVIVFRYKITGQKYHDIVSIYTN